MPVAITASASLLRRGDPQAPVVEEGAGAALGDIEFVDDRIVDDAGDDLALALERQRDGEDRDAVEEIGGAVERIDDPAVGLVAAGDLAAFLGEEAVAGPRLGSSAISISSARWSAAETKSPGPFSETCRFSTSPKSRARPRPALSTALTMTLSRAVRAMHHSDQARLGAGGRALADHTSHGASSRDGALSQSPAIAGLRWRRRCLALLVGEAARRTRRASRRTCRRRCAR